MKGKFLTVFLSLVCVIVCAFGLAACDFGGNSNGDKLDVAGYSYTFSSVDVKCEDENMKALAEMIKEQTKQQMQGNTISFFKDSTCSLTDGADVTYGTYTQNGNKGTITFNGETNNISITENSISLSNIQQGITVIAVFTKGAGGSKPDQPDKPNKPNECEHVYNKFEPIDEYRHFAYCVKCYDKKIEEHRFDGNVCICGYKYGEECNHYFIYEEYDIEIHIAYCYKCQTRIQEEHYFIDGEYCVCGMRKPVEEHRHVWSQTWETSDTHHWHNCTDKTCNEINGYAKHDFTNGDCVCGKAHPHVWSQTWETSDTHHWHNCTVGDCTERNGYATHDFADGNCVCGKEIFIPTEGLKYELNSDKQSYSVKGIGTATANKIVIPSEYEEKPVTHIASSAFRYCSSLTSITIPDSVTSIGGWAFYGCRNLTSITIPDSVTSIGDWAFDACSSLESIYYTGDIASWCGINGLNYLDLSKVYIDNQKLQEMTTITIPNSVTSIGSSAFKDCNGLTSVTIPDSVTSIGDKAFYGCSSLTSVTIPDSVTSIGNSAFSGCSSLTSITIPDSVTSIGNSAFSGCSSLTSITIPDSVTSIGSAAFYNCKGLTNLTIGNGVENIDDYTFFGCSNLTSVTIGNGVTSINTQAFTLCKKLTEINYNGTKEQWYAIEKKSSWDEYSNNFTIHCTDGDIAEEN